MYRFINAFAFCLALLFVSSFSSALVAADYFVSSLKGNDKANGRSAGAAWKTMGRALSQLGPNDTLHVFRGSVFRESVSMNAGTVQAFGPDKFPLPILSGSVQVRNWKSADHNAKIFVADYPHPVEYVYLNGKLLTLARFPNSGWLRSQDGTHGSLIPDSELAKHPRNKAGYWNGAQVRWRRWSWWYETRPIANWDGVKNLQLGGQPIGPNHQQAGWGYYIDNKFEELDTPGEWYYNANEKKLYVYPAKGVDDINTALVECIHLQKGIQMGGGTLKNIVVKHFAEVGIEIGRKSVLDGTHIRDCVNTGIAGNWDAFGTEIKNCLLEDCLNVGIRWNQKPDSEKARIHHNTLNRIGFVPGYGGSGVWHASGMIFNTGFVRADHNRLTDIGYCGFILGRDGATVDHNVITRAMSTLNDGAAIYTNCSKSIIQNNIIINSIGDLRSSGKWACLGQGIWPEFLSDFRETKIERNTIVECGRNVIYLGNNYECTITDNVLFDNLSGMYISGRAGKPPQNHEMINNTFVSVSDGHTPISFTPGYDYGRMQGSTIINPYAQHAVSVNGGNQDLTMWQSQNNWADKNPKTFIGKVSRGKSAIGKPYLFINDTENAVDMALPKCTWYTADKQEYKGSVRLEPFRSIVLIVGKGNPGKTPSYTLQSDLESAGVLAEAKADTKLSDKERKRKERKEKREKKTKKAVKSTVSDEIVSAWDKRLVAALEKQLASKKKPYFTFMAKDYQVESLEKNGRLNIRSGSQTMSYPITRLKVKDKASLSVGLVKAGDQEERAIASFYLKANKQYRQAQTMMMKLDKEQREQVDSSFQ